MNFFFAKWGPALLWMGIILTISSIPGPLLPKAGGEPRNILFHLFEYAVLGWLLLRATEGKGLFAGTISAGWAVLDEWYQSFVPGRASSVKDVIVDLAGFGLILILWKRRSRDSAESA
jgi:VanZ family protein